jgi:hypothetical protein
MRPNKKRRELANYIRRQLGQPVVDVLIDSTQIDDAIDHAVDYFGEHAGGIGHEESMIIVVPEQVKYDATGHPDQAKPKKGRWRSKTPEYMNNLHLESLNLNKFAPLCIDCLDEPSPQVQTPCTTATTAMPATGDPSSVCSTGSTGTSGDDCLADLDCSSISSVNTTHPETQYGGPDGDPDTEFHVDPACCATEVKGPGPGWCGDTIQDPHCFTETEMGDPNAEGPFWVEGDTTTPPHVNPGQFVFKSVYDVPRDVIGVLEQIPEGRGWATFDGFGETGEALFSPIHLFLNNGGLGLGGGISYGGGYVDLVGLELGLEYIEMFRRMYTIRYQVQLLTLQHQIRISPAPRTRGLLAIWCYRKVPEEYMYSHVWVREYATAMAMIQVGMNGSKYSGATFPGGSSFNAQFYIDKGEDKREKLEEQILSGMYAEPPRWFIG